MLKLFIGAKVNLRMDGRFFILMQVRVGFNQIGRVVFAAFVCSFQGFVQSLLYR